MQNNSLFELLFKRNTTDTGNRNFLEQVTKDHPYFSPAQFLLLSVSGTDEGTYKKQAAKTALLFNNPYWLHFQLDHSKYDNSSEKEISETAVLGHPDNTDEAPNENEIEPMKLELKIPANNNFSSEMPLFEPMHMVDYFASQGIKLSEEAQTSDKLGKQLKSFTEWLKTMKKVHTPLPAETVPAGEKTDTTIQNLAEKSNKEDEVLTEAMAEVFAKQGKTVKAIEVYEKLSLLNPPKIAYFAAKIEHLKGT